MKEEIALSSENQIVGSPYRQVETDKEITLGNGITVHPVATLKDESGGVAQWYIDDHCYVLCLKQEDGTYKRTSYIFKEAFKVLKTLPEPR